jgi:hypothetical protein
MGGKSTGGGTTQQASNTGTSIPDWLSSAAQGAVGTAQGLAQRPYDQYGGQIVAGTPDATTQAYQQIANMQGGTTAANQAAANQWAGVLPNLQSETPGQTNDLTNQLYGNYQQQVMNPAQGLLGGYLQGGPLTAGQVGANTQALMSPYTSSVIDPTNQLMQQQLHQNLQTIGAGANQANAFGGSRQGVQEGVAQSQAALGSEQYLGNLLNNQWNTSLGTGYNIGALGSNQGYNAANALATMGQSGYGTAAQQGANMAGTNLNLGLNAAQQIPALGSQQQTEALQATGALQGVGQAQQAQQQQDLNAQMGQFYQQQSWPVQNLDLLLSSLSGVPYDTTSMQYGATQAPSQQRNVGAGALGGAASGASIGSAFGPIGTGIGAIGGGLLGALGG